MNLLKPDSSSHTALPYHPLPCHLTRECRQPWHHQFLNTFLFARESKNVSSRKEHNATKTGFIIVRLFFGELYRSLPQNYFAQPHHHQRFKHLLFCFMKRTASGTREQESWSRRKVPASTRFWQAKYKFLNLLINLLIIIACYCFYVVNLLCDLCACQCTQVKSKMSEAVETQSRVKKNPRK